MRTFAMKIDKKGLILSSKSQVFITFVSEICINKSPH